MATLNMPLRPLLLRSLVGSLVLLTAAASIAPADPAPYIDSRAIKERFDSITAADMDALREKRILFASRSFGLNLRSGLIALARQDPKYEFLSSYERYDVFKAGGDLSIIPSDIFEQKKFVHFLATYYPHTKRMEEVDTLMRKAPHSFGNQVDAVIVFFHTATPNNFKQYASTMDALQRDFPKARLLYVTSGFMADSRQKDNDNSHAWSEQVRKRYQNVAPLYDMGKLLSDDFRCGHNYCPEYSKDPAGVHPNTVEGETALAKGFLLLLHETFRSSDAAPGKPAATTPLGTLKKDAGGRVETLPPAHPEMLAVRRILDHNGLTEKTAASVAVIENGHVAELYLQEGGMRELPDAIGRLTELRCLHLYADPRLRLARLQRISPAIGKCTKLEELLLTSNELTSLPPEITALTNLTRLSLADNRLKELPPQVKAWAEQFDAAGFAQQRP